MEAEIKDDARNYKYAIQHIAQGVELILKARLFKEHPILIYNNLDSNLTAESSTVNVEKAILRLSNVRVVFKAKERKAIKDVRKIRNRIEHKDCYFQIQETRVILGEALKFIDEFAKKELNLDIREVLDRRTCAQLANLIGFYDEQVKLAEKTAYELKKELTNQGAEVDILSCPVCFSDTLVVQRGECHGMGPHGEDDYVECDDILRTEKCEACSAKLLPLICNGCKHVYPGIQPDQEGSFFCERCIHESNEYDALMMQRETY